MVEAGKKFSRQRELICAEVKAHAVHPTAHDVYSALKKSEPNLSLATVYRNLNLLALSGKLLKIPVGNGKDRFDGRTDPHGHFICEHCGRVFDVDDELINGIGERVLKKDGHSVTSTNVTLMGICAECTQKQHRG